MQRIGNENFMQWIGNENLMYFGKKNSLILVMDFRSFSDQRNCCVTTMTVNLCQQILCPELKSNEMTKFIPLLPLPRGIYKPNCFVEFHVWILKIHIDDNDLTWLDEHEKKSLKIWQIIPFGVHVHRITTTFTFEFIVTLWQKNQIK